MNKLLIGVIVTLWAFSLQAQTPVEKSWTILKQGLAADKDETAAKAADALGILQKNDTARQMAEAALGDSSSQVRAEAATALGQIVLAASLPKLKNALTDKETEVVFAAAAAIYSMDDPAR